MSRQPVVSEVSIEKAYELADELANKTEHRGQVCTVFSGDHPTLGPIHITIPPMGESLLLPALLPVVTQNFEL